MANYTVTQIKSSIGVRPQAREYLKSLGLRGIGSTVVVPQTLSSDGLVKKAAHLIKYNLTK
jgi:large subunit ribosomal protein L30